MNIGLCYESEWKPQMEAPGIFRCRSSNANRVRLNVSAVGLSTPHKLKPEKELCFTRATHRNAYCTSVISCCHMNGLLAVAVIVMWISISKNKTEWSIHVQPKGDFSFCVKTSWMFLLRWSIDSTVGNLREDWWEVCGSFCLDDFQVVADKSVLRLCSFADSDSIVFTSLGMLWLKLWIL